MLDSWLTLVDSVLRPSRPHLELCLRERERHVALRRLFAEGRARAIANCEARIESARAVVFAAGDGVVTSTMIELERQWRRLSRPDPDAGMMDLWACVAPASWLDRKLWRGSDPAAQLDAALALAADAPGVEAAEAAIVSLGVALAAWGAPIGSVIRWRLDERDFEGTAELLAEPLRASREALPARHEAPVVERARQLERRVHEAAQARFPERDVLVRALSHAAFVDCVFQAASIAGRPNPVTSLRALWTTGYSLSALDASGVTVEIPPL